MKHLRVAGLFLLALAFSGCALFSKGEVPMRRYFSPDLPEGAATAVGARSGSELRLGRVTASAFLSERMMFRQSDHEVGHYDDRLWTEKPEQYLRRALTHELFENQGLRSVMRGAGPTLDVELLSFEEVKAPRHLGRMRVAFSLSDERVVSLQQTLCVEHLIAASSAQAEASAVADAMGDALREGVHEISERVVADLAKTARAGDAPPVAVVP